MQIQGISPNVMSGIQGLGELTKSQSSSAQKSAMDGIGETFQNVLNGLNESQMQADGLVQQMAAGENVDLHDVMIALEENDINFKVAMGIRDKLVDAYREVMRMQV
jgi:flagellar hook-basal body complex protein FliE